MRDGVGAPEYALTGRRSRALAGFAAVLLLGCGPSGPRDLLVERCREVIAYRNPALRDIAILDARRGPGSGAVTLEFEAHAEATDSTVSSRITCDFEPGDRWTLVRIEIGGRQLTEAEVALVNSELLLRDLSRSPERLGSS